MAARRSISARLRSRIAEWHRARYLSRRDFASLESRLVWMFGSPRSGSTWLLRMLAEGGAPGVAVIDETWAGALFNRTFSWPRGGRMQIVSSADSHATLAGWVLSREREQLWAPLMRAFLLEGFEDQITRGQAQTSWPLPYLVVKEPNTSEAADTLVRLLPRSRVLFLLRDGRDVVDSMLDHFSTASWGAPRELGWDSLPTEERRKTLEGSAGNWVYRMDAVQRACELVGPGSALTVRYESLLSDTATELVRIAKWLGIEASARWASEVADRHAFQLIPEDERGSGKFHRAASPGQWRENLTADEQALLVEVMGDKLRELGYDTAADPNVEH